jgi:hypothetical protein
MISVLIPTRGRPDNLRQSIASLLNMASDRGQVEILVHFDADDPLLNESLEALSASFRTSHDQYSILWERAGYWKLHVYYNHLCELARGDQLLLWNDDMEIVEPYGWEALLSDAPAFSVQQLRRDTAETADGTVPCVSRAVYQAMGHFSLNAFNDMWVGQVAEAAGIAVARDDVVFRHLCLEPKDRDLTQGTAITAEFKGPEQTALRDRDVDAIRAAIAERSR